MVLPKWGSVSIFRSESLRTLVHAFFKIVSFDIELLFDIVIDFLSLMSMGERVMKNIITLYMGENHVWGRFFFLERLNRKMKQDLIDGEQKSSRAAVIGFLEH